MSQFYMPTKVIIGKDCIVKNKNLFMLGKKALIVTGKNSAKMNGSLADVKHVLEMVNIDHEIFDQIEENPSLETVEKAKKFGLECGTDFIIGIGGGSPIDAAKAIAVMIKNPELTGETLINGKKMEAIPVIAVPTTAGTGTEVTQYSIVTDHKAKTKKNIGHPVFPILAFLDAKYMLDMSKDITIQTAVDAFTHLVESYLSKRSNIISELFVEKGLTHFGKVIGALLKGQLIYEDRENLMMASMFGGMAIAQTGTSLPHGMGYALTYYKNMPHGLANGVLYNEYFDIFKSQSKVQNIYKFLGLETHEELKNILKSLCSVDIDITDEEIEKYSKEFFNNKAKLQNHPEEITYDDIYKIYKDSFNKYL